MASYEQVFQALDVAAVPFVVVGGLAVVLRGHPRMTADVDIVIDLAVAPASRAVAALTSLGLEPRLPVDPAGFADPGTRRAWVEDRNLKVFTFVDPAGLVEVDLFAESPLPFDDLLRDSDVLGLGRTSVRVASIDHLLQMKRAAGRPQDLADVAALEALSSG